MRFAVKLSGHLPWYRKDKAREFTLEVEGAPTVREILEAAGIPPDEVSLALSGGVRSDWDDRPGEGETIEFFPVISGG
jgi:sulfur carrier protein ThiS